MNNSSLSTSNSPDITAPAVRLAGDLLYVDFNNFGIDAYQLFLKCKALPEYNIKYHRETETYTIEAPARFARMLGVQHANNTHTDLPFSDFLFDDQSAIVKMALDAKRYACWSDCGMGKSLVEMEFARHVIHRTDGRFLMFTLNEIVAQWIDMAAEFYGDSLPVHRIRTREEMREWCKGAGPGKLAITNYEKMNHKGEADQIVSELRLLAGVGLDESSRLKAGGGKQKWALIKSCRGIEYKLSCTATPAPNDTIEFASQASFLERMRNESEIIWTYFHRDKQHKWTVKRHAQKAFFEFMAGWSIYVRDPRKYGWRKGHCDIPAPETHLVNIQATPEQITEMHKFCVDRDGTKRLFDSHAKNAIQRVKLSQIAKGFVYLKGQQGKCRPINSRKPAKVAEIAQESLANGLQVLIWTLFDAESEILAQELRQRKIEPDILTGKTKETDRIEILDRFRRGESRILISRAAMLGYGMNFQKCGAMIFSGFSDSYESWYQAIRRAYRYGQEKHLQVYIPCIADLEGDMLENIFAKQAKHEAAIDEMEQNYIKATRRLAGVKQ